MKLTKQQIEEIRKMRAEGKKQVEIAKAFGIALASVQYWTDESQRQKTKERAIKRFKSYTPEQKKAECIKRREYIRNYQHNRYHTDETFRKKLIEANKKR